MSSFSEKDSRWRVCLPTDHSGAYLQLPPQVRSDSIPGDFQRIRSVSLLGFPCCPPATYPSTPTERLLLSFLPIAGAHGVNGRLRISPLSVPAAWTNLVIAVCPFALGMQSEVTMWFPVI